MGVTRKANFWRGVAALAVAVSIGACSSTPSSNTPAPSGAPTPSASAPSGDTNVCALVSAEEMTKIVGETVTAEPRTLQTGIAACSYKATSGNPTPNVMLGLHKPGGKTTYNSALSLYKGSPHYQEVSGIGEQAFDSGDGAFYAIKGDTCVDIVIAQNPDIRFNQLKQVASLAVGRLP